jgi:FAD/FMN-containing dehydrogenase
MNKVRTGVRYGVDMTERLDAYKAVQGPAWDAYKAVERSAWDAYEAVQRPAWEACVAAAQCTALDAYEAVERSTWATYQAARRPAWDAYKAVERQAWESLACGDPLVDWIISNATAHNVEAVQLLCALPATLADLDDLARDKRWCPEWDDLRDKAISDGVIA